MLVHIKEIVKKAQQGKYAVGAFNTANLETTLAIIRGAAAKKSPVIVQVSESTIKYATLKAITHIVQTLAKNEATDIPVALHLDHGKSFLSVAECIKVGFSSVHIDASELPFDENIALTKQSVDYAHRFGVWAQGELGSLFGKEGLTNIKLPTDPDQYMTDPKKVKEFVKKTKVDTLAVSVGTMHGSFKGKEKIDFKRLEQIARQVSIPLVLHGGSGVSSRNIKLAVQRGVRIINIDTELRVAFTETLRKTLSKTKGFYDPRKILAPSIEAVEAVVAKKIEIFGSTGKNK